MAEQLSLEQQKITREHIRVTPIFLSKLVANLKGGATEAAGLLKVTPETINRSLRENESSGVLEVAAQGIYEINWGNAAKRAAKKDKVAIITATESDLLTIEKLVTNIGGKFHLIP